MNLTALEKKVFVLLFNSALGNGHDFGIIEEARDAVELPRQLSGVISSLVKKGLLQVHDPYSVNGQGEPITQFNWTKDLQDIETLYAEVIHE